MSLTPRSARGIRRALLALGLSATLAAAAGCTSKTAGSKGSGNGSFTIGVTAYNMQHFAPGNTGDDNIQYAIWTPLTEIGPNGAVVNAVADSITSTDQRHWTIKLKAGWTFQNGEPVDAQSFADSWNATAYAPNAQTNNYLFANFQGYSDLNPAKGKPAKDTMSGVSVVDASTLKVTLLKPLSQFPYILSGTPFAPIPKGAAKNLTKFDKLPIGDGPFQVESPGISAGAQQITLKRFENYAGTKAKAAKVVVKAFQSSSTAYTSFQSGAIDMTLLDAGSDLASADAKYAKQLVKVTFPAVVYLGFPLWDKRFADARVREAFSLAVDRKAIVKALLQGFGEPAQSVAPKTVNGGGGADCNYCNYDPTRAKQLLAQAGGWTGSLTLWTYQDPTMNAVLQAILNELRTNLGISSIDLKMQPVGQLYPSLSAHKVSGPFLLYMGAAYPSMYAMVDQLFSKGSANNVTGYDSASVAAAMDAAAKAGSAQAAMTSAQAAAKTALADLPLGPLYHPAGAIVYSKHVSGVSAEYLGGAHLAGVSVG